MNGLLYGSDPEGFFRDKETGLFVSAHDMIPGTKEEPHKVLDGTIQADGLAWEIGIEATNDENIWLARHKSVLMQLQQLVGERYELAYVPYATFSRDYFDTLPEDVKRLGCDPDMNAYTGVFNNPPDPSLLEPDDQTVIRMGGGHIHIGWGSGFVANDPKHLKRCIDLVKMQDLYLGTKTMLWDKDPMRRKAYGSPGNFRPKSYGVEYRTPSGVWLANDNTIRWALKLAKMGAEKFFLGKQITQEELDYATMKLAA